jgi:hypothetical protein
MPTGTGTVTPTVFLIKKKTSTIAVVYGISTVPTICSFILTRSGFAACGIIPLCPDKVLQRLPPEEDARETVQNEMNEELLKELKRD